jgi:nitrogen PTS system EIIA component
VRVQDILQKNSILIELASTDKQEVLTQMTRYMVSLYDIPNGDSIAQKILERESDMSTGIGYGIAIPHGRINGIEKLYMIAGRSDKGIDFNAIDEEPVHLIFMMISPANTSTDHTNILSALSRIMSYEDVRTKLLAADSEDSFLDIIIKSENKYVD